MEDWQADIIKNNLYLLLINTTCDTHLISYLIQNNVFSESDSEFLDKEKQRSTRVFRFYQRILTKSGNAFDALLSGLEETKQSGALKILQCSGTLAKKVCKPTSSAFLTDEFVRDADIANKDDAKAAIGMYHFEMEKRIKDIRDSQALQDCHTAICNDAMKYCARRNSMDHNELLSLAFELQEQYKQYERNAKLMFNGNQFSRNESEPAIGIDLGTTNCCVALVWNGKVAVLPNKQNGKTTPSYVLFEENGKKVIGHSAKKHSYSNPTNTLFDSKRILGRTMDQLECKRSLWPFYVVAEGKHPRILANGNRFQAWQISGFLLQECKEIAERFLQQTVRKAVITVPAYFNQNQKKETMLAADFADLDVLALVNEPTAAAIAYRENRLYKDARKILVFDLGGGTFDVSILEIHGDNIETKAVTGDASLGGEDFDQKLMEYCIAEFKKQTGINVSDSRQNKKVARSKAKLLLECEEKKRDLGSMSSVYIIVDSIVGDEDMKVHITRETFEEMCKPHFEKMIDLVDQALRDAGLQKEEIDDVILVGGSTRIPKLQDMLAEYFSGKPLNFSINPDEAVAYGAAVNAAILNDKSAKLDFSLEKVEDVIAQSIGIEVKKKEMRDFSTVIPKNTKYPTTRDVRYYTTADNQTVASIKIYQGDSSMVRDNEFLGEFLLEGIPPAPAREEKVIIKMKIDSFGILVVSATSEGSGKTAKLQVTLKNDY